MVIFIAFGMIPGFSTSPPRKAITTYPQYIHTPIAIPVPQLENALSPAGIIGSIGLNSQCVRPTKATAANATSMIIQNIVLTILTSSRPLRLITVNIMINAALRINALIAVSGTYIPI